MALVDPMTWRDVDKVSITDGSISRANNGLMESADVDCVNYQQGIEQWVRIWMDAKQGDDTEHVALFTGLASSPERSLNGTLEKTPLKCYSVLKPAEDILLQRGWYAPAGIAGSTLVRQLLSVTPAPVEVVEGAPAIQTSIVAEDNESNLTMAQKILDAINWRLKISGDGRITICPKASDVSGQFDAIDNDIIEPELKISYDWYDCPNVFRAISDDLTGIARDDSEKSPLSTVNRGREVWMNESNCDLADGETLEEYALRRLREEQQKQVVISYDRRYIPGIVPTDRVRLHYPAQRIEGDYEIVSQKITVGYGSSISEEVIKV